MIFTLCYNSFVLGSHSGAALLLNGDFFDGTALKEPAEIAQNRYQNS
jgi:hypothetical protein